MNCFEFANKLSEIKPELNEMISKRKFSEKFAKGIISREFSPIKKYHSGKVYDDGGILDFLNVYNLENFRIRNISFNSELEDFGGKKIFATNSNGEVFIYNPMNKKIEYNFIDDIYSENSIFCLDSYQLFEILFALAKYSSKIYSGNIKADDETIKTQFIEEANKVFTNGINEAIF